MKSFLGAIRAILIGTFILVIAIPAFILYISALILVLIMKKCYSLIGDPETGDRLVNSLFSVDK